LPFRVSPVRAGDGDDVAMVTPVLTPCCKVEVVRVMSAVIEMVFPLTRAEMSWAWVLTETIGEAVVG
jgi:hypothetical protein